jgi:hypothetical protein
LQNLVYLDLDTLPVRSVTGDGVEVGMATGDARNAPLVLTIGLAVLGLIFAVIGVVYVTHTANVLPAVFPGHQAGSQHHHVKHAVAAFALALGCWLGAWLTSGRRPAAAPQIAE